jgi:hypothetical protein
MERFVEDALSSEDEDDEEVFLFMALGILSSNAQRNSRYLTRESILHPDESPWVHLYQYANEDSFLSVCGVNRHCFNLLLNILWPNVFENNIGRRNSLMKSGIIINPIIIASNYCFNILLTYTIGKLGLYLFFIGSGMMQKHLCLLFGVTLPVVSTVLSEMIPLVVKKLKRNADARIKFPSPEDMVVYSSMVHEREPMVNNVIGFVDGLSIPVRCSDDVLDQNAAYNGYHHDTMCNNVFAFVPTGKIVYACINFPGSWHDTTVASDLIDITVRKIGDYAFCVDSGFPRSNEVYDKFVGPITRRL